MRADPADYRQLALRAHALLAGVPLHDVWSVDLPGGGPGRTLDDLRAWLSPERIASRNVAVRALFALRRRLGGLFGWDRDPPRASEASFVHRLDDADRRASRVEPGTPDGPFRVVYAFPREALSEVHNATVHAFSLFALVEREADYRLYWAIYVQPVGRITGWYMRLIDPFRRLVIYPALLRSVRAAWIRAGAEVERGPTRPRPDP